jgi:predicted ATP-grasp superfamily ATP-dependent carboligase
VTPAVVLQASGPNALGIVRSLARGGIPVIACDHRLGALGLVSRYTRPAVLPDAASEPQRFVDELIRLGRRLPRRGVLFATHDEALAAIGPRESELDAYFHRPWSPWPAMRRALDKAEQHRAAHGIGFPVPRTVTPKDESDVSAAARELRFPLVLKPEEATGFRREFRRQVLEAADAEQLQAQWERAAAYRPSISEVIPGDDSALWTLGSYRDAQGRPLASFTGRKLRQWPPGFGTARAAEARWDPDLAGRCHELLDALEFHGISQVEVKRDVRDGRDYLIEVNPRSWLWIGLATACGVNIPEACHLDALGRAPAPAAGHPGGRRWTLLLKHLAASAGEIRRGEWALGPLARTLRPPLTDGVIDLRDPRPTIAQLKGYVRRG